MKTYYELLSVRTDAPVDEIKRAFRREIARYHPDKVQHLGAEFQQIASVRAAELTEAYRILMDAAARLRYDETLGQPEAPPPLDARPSSSSSVAPRQPGPQAHAEPASGGGDRRAQPARQASIDFVRKAALVMLRDAIDAVAPAATAGTAPGFDASFLLKGKRSLFGKAEPALRLLARVVPVVDVAAVAESWPLAHARPAQGEVACLLLMGSGVAPAKELAAEVGEQRRKARTTAGPILIPMDVRDWEALFPPDAPAAVRAIVQRLKAGRH